MRSLILYTLGIAAVSAAATGNQSTALHACSLLSDADKSVATRYGVLAQRGMANRWTFYIDKTGRIAYIDRAVNPETSAEDILGRLAQLKVATVN